MRTENHPSQPRWNGRSRKVRFQPVQLPFLLCVIFCTGVLRVCGQQVNFTAVQDHHGAMMQLGAISPNGHRLVTADETLLKLILWDLELGKALTIRDLDAPVQDLGFRDVQGDTIWLLNQEGDLLFQTPITDADPYQRYPFGADAQRITHTADLRYWAAASARNLTIYDLQGGSRQQVPLQELRPEQSVQDIRFSFDPELVLHVRCGEPFKNLTLSVPDLLRKDPLPVPPVGTELLILQRGRVERTPDGVVTIYDHRRGSSATLLQGLDWASFPEAFQSLEPARKMRYIRCASISPDNRWLGIGLGLERTHLAEPWLAQPPRGGGAFLLIDLLTGQEHRPARHVTDQAIVDVLWQNNATYWTISQEPAIVEWSVDVAGPRHEMFIPQPTRWNLEMGPNERFAAVSSRDAGSLLWDFFRTDPLQLLDTSFFTDLLIESQDSSLLLLGAFPDSTMRRSELRRYAGVDLHLSRVEPPNALGWQWLIDLAVDPASENLLLVSMEVDPADTLFLERPKQIIYGREGTRIGLRYPEGDFQGLVPDFDSSRNQQPFIPTYHQALLHPGEPLEPLRFLGPSRLYPERVQVTGDGRHALLYGFPRDGFGSEELVELYTLDREEPRMPPALQGVRIRHVGVDERHQQAALLTTDSTLLIWDLTTDQIAQRFGLSNDFTSLALHPNGGTVLLQSADGHLAQFLRTTFRRTEYHGVHPEFPPLREISPDGRFAVFADAYGLAVLDITEDRLALPLQKLQDFPSDLNGYRPGEFPKMIQDYRFLTESDSTVQRLLFWTMDGQLTLWDLYMAQAQGYARIVHDGEWLVWTPGGTFDASPQALQEVYYVIGDEIIDLDQVKSEYWMPFLWEILLNNPEKARDLSREQSILLRLYPEISTEVNARKMEVAVQLQERNGGIGPTILKINGKQVSADINPERVSTFRIALEDFKNYLLPDTTNRLSLTTTNQEGWLKSRSRDIVLNPEVLAKLFEQPRTRPGASLPGLATLNNPPQFYGLVVGVSDYAGSSLKLTYPDADARAVAAALEEITADDFGPENTHIVVLSSSAETGSPDKETILRTLDSLVQGAKPQDALLLFLSGHGVNTEDEFHFLTEEATDAALILRDTAVARQHSISGAELVNEMFSLPINEQILVIAACNAGQIQGALTNSSLAKRLKTLGDNFNVHILSSSSANQQSFEDDLLGHEFMTYTLLLGLSGDGLEEENVLVKKLFDYSQDQVGNLSRIRDNSDQTALYFSPTGSRPLKLGDVDKENLPMLQDKVLFGKVSLLKEPGDFASEDELNLSEKINDLLPRENFQGSQSPILFAVETPARDFYKIRGAYEIRQDTLHLRYVLFNRSKRVSTQDEFIAVPYRSVDRAARLVVRELRKRVLELTSSPQDTN